MCPDCLKNSPTETRDFKNSFRGCTLRSPLKRGGKGKEGKEGERREGMKGWEGKGSETEIRRQKRMTGRRGWEGIRNFNNFLGLYSWTTVTKRRRVEGRKRREGKEWKGGHERRGGASASRPEFLAMALIILPLHHQNTKLAK